MSKLSAMTLIFVACGLTLGASWIAKEAKSAPDPLAPAPHANATQTSIEPFLLGLGGVSLNNQARLNASLPKICELGVNSVRGVAAWADVEQSPGKYSVPKWWTEHLSKLKDCGVRPLVVLAYGNRLYGPGKPTTPEQRDAYTKYAGFLVKAFAEYSPIYEVWNEWNGRTGGTPKGDIQDYVELTKSIHSTESQQLSTKRPLFIGASYTGQGLRNGLLQNSIDLGLSKYLDGYALHTYVYKTKRSTPEDWSVWVDGIESDLRRKLNGNDVPLYITETGWPTRREQGPVSEEVQSAYLARFILLARSKPFIKGVWWFSLQDVTKSGQYFGILNADGTPKLAYWAMKDVASLISKTTSVDVSRIGQGVYLGKIGLSDGSSRFALWSADDVQREITLISTKAAESNAPKAQIIGTAPGSSIASPIKANGRNLAIRVSGRPVVITADFASYRIENISAMN